MSGLIPSAEVLSADVVRIEPLLREAREQLAAAKDSWLKAATGRAENLPKLKQTLASVHNKAVEITHGALMKLTAALVERVDKLPAAGVPEPLAMEYATALLLAEISKPMPPKAFRTTPPFSIERLLPEPPKPTNTSTALFHSEPTPLTRRDA